MKLRALSDASALTIVLVVVLTLAGEVSAPFKGLLASITGHHWVAKSVISLLCFSGVYALGPNGAPRVKPVLCVSIAGVLIIFSFYVWHYVG